jgi:hypothetical protein
MVWSEIFAANDFFASYRAKRSVGARENYFSIFHFSP